ncbi:MAG: translocation/assembly module TamB domain-containing protein, partial [Polyangiales bacterium]
PTATDAQIMNLLVLGRRDAGTATDQQSTTAAASAETAAIAGAMSAAVVGGQLQRMLPTNVSLSVRPGTTGVADARVAAGYQWNRVYFEVGYNAGAQTVAPGATSQSTTTVGMEWRFVEHWSLLTTLGDTGSALVDLVWQFRY